MKDSVVYQKRKIIQIIKEEYVGNIWFCINNVEKAEIQDGLLLVKDARKETTKAFLDIFRVKQPGAKHA